MSLSLRGVSASFSARKSTSGHEDLVQLIEASTSGGETPDAELNAKIVQEIQGIFDHKVLSELVRRMRKKLKASNPETVMNALVLMDTLMQECHKDFHMTMSNRKLMQQMLKVVKANYNSKDPIRKLLSDKCLELIGKWGTEFASKRGTGLTFVETYESLLAKGLYQFPTASANEGVSQPSTIETPLHSLPLHEREEMVSNVTRMLTEMIMNSSSKEEILHNELIQQLGAQCQTFQNEIAQMLSDEDENDIESLLKLNENVLACLKVKENGENGTLVREPLAPKMDKEERFGNFFDDDENEEAFSSDDDGEHDLVGPDSDENPFDSLDIDPTPAAAPVPPPATSQSTFFTPVVVHGGSKWPDPSPKPASLQQPPMRPPPTLASTYSQQQQQQQEQQHQQMHMPYHGNGVHQFQPHAEPATYGTQYQQVNGAHPGTSFPSSSSSSSAAAKLQQQQSVNSLDQAPKKTGNPFDDIMF